MFGLKLNKDLKCISGDKKKARLVISGPNWKGIKQIEEWLKTTASVFVCLGGGGVAAVSQFLW